MGRNSLRALPAALGGAAAAFIAGQLGPQAAVPEEAITVPWGFGTGMAIGSTWEMFKLEAGSAFNEYLAEKDENGAPMYATN